MNTTITRLAATLVTIVALLFGGTVAASAADDTTPTACGVNDPACPTRLPDCTDPALSRDPICGRIEDLTTQLVEADQTANDYRQQVVALTAQVEHVQRIAARRAATIQRLRAKIRALR